MSSAGIPVLVNGQGLSTVEGRLLTWNAVPLNEDPAPEPRLLVGGVSKSFGRTRALVDVSLRVAPGEIHALLGQNGSGKSTLVKILSGYWSPDKECELSIDGRALRVPVAPKELRRQGMAFVHQDLGLVDSLSVLDNVRVGSFAVRRLSRSIRWQQESAAVCRELEVLDCHVNPRALVGQLSASERARVAIARALRDRRPGGGLVVFDEATRALPRDATRAVHAAIRRIAAEGVSVLFVSHRLDEVVALADRATILRDGRVVESSLQLSGLNEADLARTMLGYDLDSSLSRGRSRFRDDQVFVSATGVRGRLVSDAAFVVKRGEVVGATGVPGSGYEELPYLLTGAHRARSGFLTVGRERLDLRRAGHAEFAAAKVALVPERRDVYGLVLNRTIRDNVTLPRVRLRGSRFYTGRRWQQEEAEYVLRTFQVNTRDPGKLVGQLSGGNQQKVLLGKWLLGAPDFLVVHEPTQGVDVGVRREILRVLAEVADGGCSVVLASAEPEDLASLCDRVLVINEGEISHEIAGPCSPADIVSAVYGRADVVNGPSVSDAPPIGVQSPDLAR